MLSWLLVAGASAVEFSAPVVIDGPVGFLQDLDLADLDADGDLDILAVTGEGSRYGELRWYENLGGGTFAPPVVVAAPWEASMVRAADYDDDGDLDIVIASAGGPGLLLNELSAYPNLGGTFGAPAVAIPTLNGAPSRDAWFEDFDGDGISDLVHGGFWGTYAYPGLGGGTFDLASWANIGGTETWSTRTVDIDQDGDADILIGNSSYVYYPGALTLRMNLAGTFGSRITLAFGVPWAVDGGDLDGNGTVDVVANVGSTLQWLPNNGSSFDPRVQLATGVQYLWIDAVDVDQDGDTDLIATSTSAVDLYVNDGAAGFASEVLTTGPMVDHVPGDVTGDGLVDVLIGGDEIALLVNSPVDEDGDGHPTVSDCNDADPAVFPGAVEVCNGIDDDCDGAIDEVCDTGTGPTTDTTPTPSSTADTGELPPGPTLDTPSEGGCQCRTGPSGTLWWRRVAASVARRR